MYSDIRSLFKIKSSTYINLKGILNSYCTGGTNSRADGAKMPKLFTRDGESCTITMANIRRDGKWGLVRQVSVKQAYPFLD